MTNRTALLYFLPRCMRWLEAMMCSLGGLVACGLLVNSKITVTPWEQTQIIFFFTCSNTNHFIFQSGSQKSLMGEILLVLEHYLLLPLAA